MQFQCTLCPKSFQSQKAKIAHAKVHSKRRTLSCGLCNAFCTSLPKFKQHFGRFHSNITGPVCPLCGVDLSFTSKESCQQEVLWEGDDREVNLAKLHAEHLQMCPNHKTAEPAIESYKCAKCNLSFRRKAQLHRHQLSVHDKDDESDEGVEGPEVIVDLDENNDPQSIEEFDSNNTLSGTENIKADKPFKCFYCPKSFATENARSGHGKIHGDVKPFRCLICSVGIASLAKFKAHLVQKHPDAEEYTCPLCDSALNALAENGQFQCPSEICTQKFDSISKLRNHHLAECAQKIENERKLLCFTCSTYFSNEEEIGAHRCEQDTTQSIPTNETKADESSQASVGGKKEVFETEESCVRSHDTEEASDPSWSQKTAGKSKRSIRPAQPYRCKICSERFSQLYGLKRHFRSHGRACQTSCPLCGINFKAEENTSSDGATEMLKCPLRKCCDRTFDNVAALRAHHFLKCPENPKVKERTRVSKKALSCLHCPASYGTAEELKQHIGASHLDQNSEVMRTVDVAEGTSKDVTDGSSSSEFKCPFCLKKFSKEVLMNDHMNTYHKSKPYSCKICRHRFTQVKNLRRHVLQVHRSNAQLMCHYCGEDFKSGGEERPFKCRLFGCDLVFESLSELRSHHFLKCPQNPELKDVSNAAYSCDTCGRLFTTEAYLRNHIISIHQKQDRVVEVGERADGGQEDCDFKFKCSMCPKKFSSEAALNTHMQSHQDTKPFQCKVCSLVFSRLINMRKHFLTSHAEIAEFTCEYCGHNLGENKDDETGLFRCDLPDDCQLLFQTPALLRQHHLSKCTMKPNRSNEGGYTCERCGKSFLGHVALKDHIATIHEKAFKFYCDKCGRGFQKFCELKRHTEFVHSSEKRYECDVCKLRFKRSNQLFYHRRMHTGERPYVCEVCGKAFHIPGKLRSHVALHSGKKEFPCSLCGKLFASKSYVTYHINFTHKGRTRAKKNPSLKLEQPQQQQEVLFEVTTNPVIEIEFQPVSEHDAHTTVAPLVFEHLTVVDGTVVSDSLTLPCTSEQV